VNLLLMNVLQLAAAFTYRAGRPMICKERCQIW
jgi:hypothetical protein